MTLGEKIKKARQNKRLTQKELAGDKITRNMLSRIEGGYASPSLETLKFLAEQLSLPLPYLLSEDDDIAFYQKKEYIKEIYESYNAKNYKACINMINRIEEKDEELYYILASAHFELGKRQVFNGELNSAKKNLEISLIYSKKTVHKTEHIESLIPMYCAIAQNVHSPLLEFDHKSYLDGLYDTFDYEFFKYLTLDFEYSYTNEILKKHIAAKKEMKVRDYAAAIKNLTEAADLNFNDKKSYNAFVIFGIYTDLENCYKQLYDFESAYRYSSKRLSLIEGFKD
jgi:transcriptional regulator with XRE-family HTH domain